MAGMPFVLVRFIDHAQACGGESSGQLFRDDIGSAHSRALRPFDRGGQPAKLETGNASFCFVKLAAAASASA
jgi:hypothetical protein